MSGQKQGPGRPGGLSRRDFAKASLFVLGSFSAVGGLLTGCSTPSSTPSPSGGGGGSGGGGKPVIRIGDWGGFWEELNRKLVLNDFEKEHNCTVEYDPSWPYFPKLVAGDPNNPPLDIVNDNLPDAYRAARAGLYVSPEEIKQNCPNAADLWDFAFTKAGVIWLFTVYGTGYRKDQANPAPKGFKEIWHKQFDGKRGTYVTSNTLLRVHFLTAAKAFGSGESDYDAGLKALETGAPWKVSDFTGNMQALLERGEVLAAVMPENEMYLMQKKGAPVAFDPWAEAPVLCQNKAVVKGSRNKELAYKLLDRYLDPKVQDAWNKELASRPTNKKAQMPAELEAQGIKNDGSQMQNLWIPNWDAWLDNESKLTEQLNKVLGGRA